MEQIQKPIAAARTRPRARRWTIDHAAAVAMITPSVIAIAIFVYGFIGWTGYVSLSNWRNLVPDLTFVGLRNYATIFTQQRFQTDIRNTIVFTLFFLIGCLSIGLLLAVLLDSKVKGE